MQEQSQIVQKWTNTGFLRDVKPHLVELAAERLEASQRGVRGGYSATALDTELQALDREGYFNSRSMNSSRR